MLFLYAPHFLLMGEAALPTTPDDRSKIRLRLGLGKMASVAYSHVGRPNYSRKRGYLWSSSPDIRLESLHPRPKPEAMTDEQAQQLADAIVAVEYGEFAKSLLDQIDDAD